MDANQTTITSRATYPSDKLESSNIVSTWILCSGRTCFKRHTWHVNHFAIAILYHVASLTTDPACSDAIDGEKLQAEI